MRNQLQGEGGMAVYLPVPSFLLFSLLLHFISLFLFLSVSVTFLFLVNQCKWKANGKREQEIRVGSSALLLLAGSYNANWN